MRAQTTMDLEHAWSGLPLLRDMETACAGPDSGKNYWEKAFYWEHRATAESLVGNHGTASVYGAKVTRHHPDGLPARVALPSSATATAALPYIVGRAARHRVVMVNERHLVSTDRLLTLALLRPLYGQGFRHLAVEALWRGQTGLNERGYPIRESGFYASDVVFAELLREAIALGYRVVPYEASQEQGQATDTLNDLQARDYWQARNLIAATLDLDPEAKVLVHSGLAHIEEAVSPGWWPMGHYFREETGLDPLTVDQTLLAERGTDDFEHGWRVDAESRGLIQDGPVVLLDGEGDLLQIEPDRVDIRVLNPRTQFVAGRPAWMGMGGRRRPVQVDTAECAEDACVVSAFDVRWGDRAVPYDRVETGTAAVNLYLPQDAEMELRGHRLDGTLVFRRLLTTPP
ncbi:MAG: hypothetical protein OXG82_13710 [Gammaproteobacteria bacterium]|nr:hypothetical protein [Gammaproteobacteria bacterium]